MKINKEQILSGANELELELIEFLDDNPIHTLYRWLLTLSEDETQELADIWSRILDNQNNDDEPSLLALIVLMNQDKYHFTHEELQHTMSMVATGVTMISLVKKKLVSYTMKPLDENWEFKIIEAQRENIMKSLGMI